MDVSVAHVDIRKLTDIEKRHLDQEKMEFDDFRV